MDIFEFCEQFPTKEHAIAYMRNRGLLKQIAPVCGRNGCVMSLKRQNFFDLVLIFIMSHAFVKEYFFLLPNHTHLNIY